VKEQKTKNLGIPISVLQVSHLSEVHEVLASFGGEGINALFSQTLTVRILKFHGESLKPQLFAPLHREKAT